MPTVTERYDPSRIERLRRSLQRESERGQPRDFEIHVDGFKIVPRTNNIDEFDEYEQEITDTSRNLSFLLYDGPGTNRNTRYSFSFQQEPVQQEPATLGAIDQLVAQKITEREKDYELSRMREQLSDTKEQLEEAEEYSVQLQQRITQLEQEQKGKMLKLGDLGASVLMGLLRTNAHNLPGGAALAGLLGADTTGAQDAAAVTEGQASYSKAEVIDEQTRGQLNLLAQMQQKLDETQMIGVLNIIGYVTEQPHHISTIIALLQSENAQAA